MLNYKCRHECFITGGIAPNQYPSSSHYTRNWDKVAKDVEKMEAEEKKEGDAAVNDLFQKIYADGSDEVKKAMNKSFVSSYSLFRSNIIRGTVLIRFFFVCSFVCFLFWVFCFVLFCFISRKIFKITKFFLSFSFFFDAFLKPCIWLQDFIES